MKGAPYVVALVIWVDGERLGVITASSDGRRIEIVDLNFDHPMLRSEALSVRGVLSQHNALSAGEALPLQLHPGPSAGALPRTDRDLAIVLSGVIVPLAALQRELGLLLHVGPFRAIPARSFVPHESLQKQGRRTGTTAWPPTASWPPPPVS